MTSFTVSLSKNDDREESARLISLEQCVWGSSMSYSDLPSRRDFPLTAASGLATSTALPGAARAADEDTTQPLDPRALRSGPANQKTVGRLRTQSSHVRIKFVRPPVTTPIENRCQWRSSPERRSAALGNPDRFATQDRSATFCLRPMR